jgi:hypothetical protein
MVSEFVDGSEPATTTAIIIRVAIPITTVTGGLASACISEADGEADGLVAITIIIADLRGSV